MAKGKRKRALQVWDLYNKANNSFRRKWLTIQQKGYDFYLNDQLTADERTTLRDAGMPDFIINRMMPIIEVMLYFVTAKNPRWKVVGVEGSDSDMAQIHSEIADRGWYISGGQKLFASVIRNALTKSIGYFFVYTDTDADRGRGEVKVASLDTWDVLVAEQAKDFLFEDAPYIIISKIFPKSQLINELPKYAAQIRKATGEVENRSYSERDLEESESIQNIDLGNTFTGADGYEEELINYFELYEKVRVPYVHVYMVIQPSEEDLRKAMRVVDIQMKEFEKELDVQLEEKKEQIISALENGEIIEERAELELERAQKMMKQAIQERRQLSESRARDSVTTTTDKIITKEEFNILWQDEEFRKTVVDYAEYYETRIKKTCSVGTDQLLYEEIDPVLDEYPIIGVPYLWTDSPYPMSACTPLVGKQQEINKAHQLMIHNANLSSNLRWLYQEGQIIEEEWEKYSSSPGALLKWIPGATGDAPPQPIQPLPLNNAFYTITQQGERDMEYVSGIQSQLMGFTEDAPDTYRGLLANDEYGTRRIRQWISNIVEPALEKVGRVFMKLAQAHYTVHKVFRIVQPEAGEDERDYKETEINIPIYNDYGEQIGKFNDYNSSQFDLRIVPGSTLPLNRWALLEEYFRWFQAGILDDVAFVAETDIRNKKQLLARKSLYSQLQQQIQAFENEVKSLSGDKETLMRQIMQMQIKLGSAQDLLESKKDILETEAQQKVFRNEMKTAKDKALMELKKDQEIIKERIKAKEASKNERQATKPAGKSNR